MATWHQNRNPENARQLWAPEPGKWKCVSDKPNRMASCMVFDDEEAARRYCEKTGDVLIPPAS